MSSTDKKYHYGRIQSHYNQKVVVIPELHGLKIGDYVKVKEAEK